MTKEQIIEQINKSFSEYKGTNEAIDDAAFYIEAAFNKLTRQPLSDEEIGKLAENVIGKKFSEMSDDYRSWYHAFIQGYKANTNRSEWVRVEDRLPELTIDKGYYKTSLDVLVLDIEGDYNIARLEKDNDSLAWYCPSYDDTINVTQWQPLPTPPTK